MPSPSLRRKTVVLLLGAALALSWSAAAAPRHATPARAEAPSPVSPSFLGRLWGFLTSAWDEAGCRLDPNGLCVDNPSSGLTAPADSNCSADPNGCRTAQPLD